MTGFFKKIRIEYIVQSLIVIAVGVLFIGWAPAVIPLMARVLAVLLFIVGTVFVIAYFVKKERGFLDFGQLVFGVVVAAVGVWIFLDPIAFTNFIPRIFGAFILISGLQNLGQTFSLVRYKYGMWWLSLIFALATVGLGAGLIFKAAEANELIVRLIGGFLVYDGLSNLWTSSRVEKYRKAFEQARKDMEAVDTTAEEVDDSAER